MKKVFALLIAAAMMLSFGACGSETGKETVYEIVVVPAVWSDELDAQIKEYVKDRPELNVYQNMVQEKDAKYQALLVEDLMAQKVDAICLQPIDDTVLPMVQKAEEAGIIVITGDDMLSMIDQAEKELNK